MDKTPPKHLSGQLIADLVDTGILRVNHNKVKAQQIIRHYFVEIHKKAVNDTRCACNKVNYTEPGFNDEI